MSRFFTPDNGFLAQASCRRCAAMDQDQGIKGPGHDLREDQEGRRGPT